LLESLFILTSSSLLASLVLACAAPGVLAADLNAVNLTTQAEFRALSEDLSGTISYKPLIPAESMGITGFDIGVAVTGTRLADRDVWAKAAGGSSPPATLPTTLLRVHKGLPWDIDIGASYASIPSAGVQAVGGEVRWAVVPGGTVTPAFALRASLSHMSGVENMKLDTVGLDASISKGFAIFTPYAGVGTVFVRSKAEGASTLGNESFNQFKVFAGANINLGLANVLIETDKTGDTTSYGVKVGLRF